MLLALRRALLPHYEGEERALHLRLVRLILRVWALILAVWLVGRVVLYLTIGYLREPGPAADLLSILYSIIAIGLGYALHRGERVLAAGYLMASAVMLYPTVDGMLFPSEAFLLTPVAIVAVFIASAVVSPAAGYLYAFGGLAVNLFTWLQAGRTLVPPSTGFDTTAATLFLVVQTAILFFAAAMLHAYASQARRAMDQLNHQAEQMTELAHTDALTGLANRRWLLELLDREFHRARRYHRPLTMIYIDLDGFKEVNDAFGHLFGDGLLRSAARSMQAVLRAADFLARIGGDEFAVLLPETEIAGADNVVGKLRRALLSTTRPYGASLPPLTFSAGVSQLRDDDRTIDDLLARADDAQYLAKGAGRGVTRSELDLSRSSAPRASAPTTDAPLQAHDGPDAGD
jgi:diguanylate cyclase (GGDEF)-like protein